MLTGQDHWPALSHSSVMFALMFVNCNYDYESGILHVRAINLSAVLARFFFVSWIQR